MPRVTYVSVGMYDCTYCIHSEILSEIQSGVLHVGLFLGVGSWFHGVLLSKYTPKFTQHTYD